MESLSGLPEVISDEASLEELLSRPPPEVVDALSRMDSDLMVLGAGGKMGPTLCRMAVRAIEACGSRKKVYGAARFSDESARQTLEACGVETIGCDLLDRSAVSALPRVGNVIYMVGKKFGTQERAARTWAVNVLAAHNACSHFAGSRMVAFSTGCVYPLVSAASGGCAESEPPAPVGDYAQSCLGRERVFEFASLAEPATAVCLLRLNYAVDLRYGVLHDIAQRVYHGEPVDLTASHFNVIWQGDACAQALRCLEHCTAPASPLNITGPETVPTRSAAQVIAHYLGKQVHFSGSPEESRMYLSDAARAAGLFGYPSVPLETMIRWQAHWIASGGRSLGKPTQYEVADGKF